MSRREASALPQGRQLRTEMAQLVAQGRIEGRHGRRLHEAFERFSGLDLGAQCKLPPPLSFGRHQSVVRVDGMILSLGQVHLIFSAFHLIGLLLGALRLFRPLGRQHLLQQVEFSRGQRREEGSDDCGINLSPLPGSSIEAHDTPPRAPGSDSGSELCT